MPFLRDALGGSSTVSTFDVDEMSTGSEISFFEMLFLRSELPNDRCGGTDVGEVCPMLVLEEVADDCRG